MVFKKKAIQIAILHARRTYISASHVYVGRHIAHNKTGGCISSGCRDAFHHRSVLCTIKIKEFIKIYLQLFLENFYICEYQHQLAMNASWCG